MAVEATGNWYWIMMRSSKRVCAALVHRASEADDGRQQDRQLDAQG